MTPRFARCLTSLVLLFWLTPSPAPAADEGLRAALQQRLQDSGETLEVGGRSLPAAALVEVYGGRGFQPIWIDQGRRNARAEALTATLARADREGLEPGDYALPTIETMEPLELELALSATLMRYANDLGAGRSSPKKADPEFYVFPQDVDRRAVLAGAAEAADPVAFFAGLAPASYLYRNLRRTLADYRALQAKGGWTVVPEGPTLKPGESSGARVAALRQHLVQTGDLTIVSQTPEVFDAGLALAVEAFQRRHGLDTDAAVGPATLAALNVPVETRIEQIVLNMERARWMPDDLGDKHVIVNIAGFDLGLWEEGSFIMGMRVVVGRPYRRSPIFSDEIEFLEINPTWTVPPTILRNDVLPKVKKDPGYLARENMRLIDRSGRAVDPASVDWARASPGNLPYAFRQDPGPNNALGRIKFMFPNRFAVYLHDTPARELFRRTNRAFSSGCIRVEKPFELAVELLEGTNDWTVADLDSRVGGKTERIDLKTPIPVHLTYLTAWSGEGGAINFRDDIYERDAGLRKALFGG